MRYPFLAEIAGFELARRNIYRPTAFRVRTLQPLGYFSIYFYNIIILAEKSLICKRKFYSHLYIFLKYYIILVK